MGGVASLDVTGDGISNASDTAALPGLGIDSSELAALGAEYTAGKKLWRTRHKHFSAWDLNWGIGPPPDAVPPPVPAPQPDDPDDPCERAGSIIGCESRTLGEELAIVGTPYKLRYQSNRSAGFASRVRFQVTDGTALPASLQRARIQVDIAGRHFEYTKPAPLALNDSFTFTWDGMDAYGRRVAAGTYEASVRVGFDYGAVITRETPDFGAFPGTSIGGDRAARIITLWRAAKISILRADAAGLGFGGWTLDANHILDQSDTPTIFMGNGHRRRFGTTNDVFNYVIETVAGGGSSPNFNDNGLATQAYLGNVDGFARGPDGSLYIASDGYTIYSGRVRRVGPDGIITTLAGVTPVVAKVDGAPALNADVDPTAIAVAPDGSIVFAEANNHQVWKIIPGLTPTLRLVAGNGLPPPNSVVCPMVNCGDGGDATAADLRIPTDVAVASDGTVFIVDSGHNRVRRVGPEGKISTYYSGDSSALALRADGVIFVTASSGSLVRIEPAGSAQTVLNPAGSGLRVEPDVCGFSDGYGGRLAALADESLVVGCYSKVVLRTPKGKLLRLAGPDTYEDYGFSGDGGPALRAKLQLARSLVAGAHGEFFVAVDGRIRRLRGPGPATDGAAFRVPSEDTAEIYEFDIEGKHVRTLSGLRGTATSTFSYDATTGLLTSITDVAGNATVIARSSGHVTITAPHGQVTNLALDASGHLASVTNPAATEVTQLAHSTSGLLTDLVDPLAHTHHFEYAGDGRLTKDVDATPSSLGTRLSAVSDSTGWTVEITSPEGRVTRHKVDQSGDFGDTAIRERRTITSGASLAMSSDTSVDNAHKTTQPDGTIVTVLGTAADPRWGVLGWFASAVQTDVGLHSMIQTESRTATLATAGEPLSVTALTITTTRAPKNGSVPPSSMSTRVFSAGPPAKWTITSAAGVVVEQTLDNLERVVASSVLGSSPITLNPLQYHYDAQGRVDQVIWGTRVYTTAYNASTGWPSSTTAPGGLGVSYDARDADGRPTLMTLPGSRALAMSYDRAGNMISVTPPSRPAHAFSFDANDRLASYVPPDLVPTLSPKDTPYARDRDGLVILAGHPGKSATFAYDFLGRLTRRIDAVTTSQVYDAQGRLSSVTTSDGVTLTNTYDVSLLAQQAVSGPFSHAVNKTYDNFLRLSSWNLDGTGAIAVSYDLDDRVTSAGGMSLTRGTNGLLTGTLVGSVSDSFGFNGYGEVVSHGVSGSATAFSVTTTRDVAGRIDLRTETIGGVTHSYQYGYDTAGRLAAVYVDGSPTATRAWTYDANGNRAGGTYDAQDRLTALGSVTYAYGNNGELAKKTDGSGDTFYGYDANGNLRSVTGPGLSLTYVIDGQNRRIGKKAGGSLVQGFVYDGSRIVAELGSTGAEVARFVYTTGGHSPDVMIKSGVTYRIVKDHLGSPRLIVNSSTGAVAQRLDYDEWGVMTDTAPGFQPFGFAGGLWDRDTKLVRFGARDYDPTTGRWVTKDRIRFYGGDLNLYAYVSNNPVNLIDSDGLRTECSSEGGNCAGGPYPGPSEPSPYDPAADDGGFCGSFPQLCTNSPPGSGPHSPGGPMGGDGGGDLMCSLQPPPECPDYGKASLACSEECQSLLGESPWTKKKKKMGSNTQFRFDECWKKCMESMGCK